MFSCWVCCNHIENWLQIMDLCLNSCLLGIMSPSQPPETSPPMWGKASRLLSGTFFCHFWLLLSFCSILLHQFSASSRNFCVLIFLFFGGGGGSGRIPWTGVLIVCWAARMAPCSLSPLTTNWWWWVLLGKPFAVLRLPLFHDGLLCC